MTRTIARPPDPPYNAEKAEGPSHPPLCTNTIYPLAGCPVLIGARQAGATGSPTGSSGFRKVPPQRSLKKSIRAALNRTGFLTLGSSGFRSGVGRASPALILDASRGVSPGNVACGPTLTACARRVRRPPEVS